MGENAVSVSRVLTVAPVVALLCAFGVLAEEPPLSPEGFTINNDALPAGERMDLYLQLIENFVGWVEHEGAFVGDEGVEPGGGYFDASGSGVTWQRGNSNLCIAYAVLLTAHPERTEFSAYEIERVQLEDHLRRAMRALCIKNKNCSRHVPGEREWGGPSWQAALSFTGCAWAAHLMEGQFDEDTLALVREVSQKEADNLDKEIPNAAKGNTASEDCSWNAPLAAFVANKYVDHPKAKAWDELARRWAINSVSAPKDAHRTLHIDGQSVKKWMVSKNIFEDLTLENHGFWSVPYQFAFELLGEAELAYGHFGRPVPESLYFRAQEMWDGVNGVLSLWDGDTLFPHGQDWAWKDFQHLEYFCWQTTCRGNAAAGAFESRALQLLARRQLGAGTGGLDALNLGYQTHACKRWAFCYLMHKQFPAPEALPFAVAEVPFHGVHVYKDVRTAIHRTKDKLVSVSWHPRSPAVFPLFASAENFANPPFFVLNERETGVARVRMNGGSTPPAALPEPMLHKAGAQGNGIMRVHYSIPYPGATQYVTVLSMPDETTIYATAFRATATADVTVSPLFPLWFGVPPGLEADLRQTRGENWLNLSGKLGFIATQPLPEDIPEDRFYLTEEQTHAVEEGQWFGETVLAIFAGQPRLQTEMWAPEFAFLETPKDGLLDLRIRTREGRARLPIKLRP